ncbi:MAG: phytanoyl-CoA dioxygenase family protein [Polyangiales bacterium]
MRADDDRPTEIPEFRADLALDRFDEVLRAFRRAGVVLLRGLATPAQLDAVQSAYDPVLAAATERRARGDRGSFRAEQRHHLSLAPEEALSNPLSPPWVRDHPLVTSLVSSVFAGPWRRGPTQVECALPGCAPMPWHSDAFPPDLSRRKRTVRVALQVPMIDVDASRGPTEVDLGSHTDHYDRWARETRGAPRHPRLVLTRRGDAFLRDGDLIHRGTVNRSDAPRPMLSQLFLRDGPVDWWGLSARRVARYARARLALRLRRVLPR